MSEVRVKENEWGKYAEVSENENDENGGGSNCNQLLHCQ